MKNSQVRIIDLFAGIGGMRLAAESAFGNERVHCVFTSEKDNAAVTVYQNYFCDDLGHEFNYDICDLYPDDLDSPGKSPRKTFADVPEHDLLLAGFPCQPFSMAGRRLGKSDERSLFDAILQVIINASVKPKVLVLENVRGLKSIDGGETLREIVEALSEWYHVPEPQVLNARDFGLPQNRNRLFIVGIRKDLRGAADYAFPDATHDRNETRVGHILDPNADIELLTISDRLWEGHRKRRERNVANGKGFGYRLVSPESNYTATLSARYYKDGSEILVEQYPQNPRKISVIEARNLQGFPKTFSPSSSKVQAYKQFGNAVPVPVVAAILRSLASYLLA